MKEQVEWKSSKKSLVNEIKTPKEEKNSFFGKIGFLKNQHFQIKKKSEELRNENLVIKQELSCRKEKAHPSSQKLNELNNSGHKFTTKRGIGFIDETTTPSG